MKIAIDAADLCDERVDGTRIYIKNVLDHLGGFAPRDKFLIYLRGRMNRELIFKGFSNYVFRKDNPSPYWTQLAFPKMLKKDQPDVLWMPLQTVPWMISKSLKIVVTIHDLAFKFFPDHFPFKERFFLNLFSKIAIKRANKIIAVSKSTRDDINKYYPNFSEKIEVVYHGVNHQRFNLKDATKQEEIKRTKQKYQIRGKYLLYVGALQPRKNLETLIEAFNKIKGGYANSLKFLKDLKLVLAGEKAWLYRGIFKMAKRSDFKEDIIFTGGFSGEDLVYLFGGAEAFIFPSLYEGFGLPIIEALACGTPTVCAENSSLEEIGKGAVHYFRAKSPQDLAVKIIEILESEELKKEMQLAGLSRAKNFSWEKCAEETLNVLKGSNA